MVTAAAPRPPTQPPPPTTPPPADDDANTSELFQDIVQGESSTPSNPSDGDGAEAMLGTVDPDKATLASTDGGDPDRAAPASTNDDDPDTVPDHNYGFNQGHDPRGDNWGHGETGDAYSPVIEAAAADSTSADASDDMMGKANSQDAELTDFEDALVEEDLDLLADADTQQQQAQSIYGAQGGGLVPDLLGKFKDQKVPSPPPPPELDDPERDDREITALQLKADLTSNEYNRLQELLSRREQRRVLSQTSQSAPDTEATPPPSDVDGDGIPDSEDTTPMGTSTSGDVDSGFGHVAPTPHPLGEAPQETKEEAARAAGVPGPQQGGEQRASRTPPSGLNLDGIPAASKLSSILGPAPGQAQGQQAQQGPPPPETLDRIHALLSRGYASEHPGEAKVSLNLAKELMRRHGLSEDDVVKHGGEIYGKTDKKADIIQASLSSDTKNRIQRKEVDESGGGFGNVFKGAPKRGGRGGQEQRVTRRR